MPDFKVMVRCATCGGEFRMGPDRYEGQHVPRYQITVCGSCYAGNWDGWAPHFEDRVVAVLKSKGLPIPERNAKGWLPRD